MSKDRDMYVVTVSKNHQPTDKGDPIHHVMLKYTDNQGEKQTTLMQVKEEVYETAILYMGSKQVFDWKSRGFELGTDLIEINKEGNNE